MASAKPHGVCVHNLQGNQPHDVLPAVPSGHLCSPAGVCRLLGRHCFVSFNFMCVYVWMHAVNNTVFRI